MRRLAALFPISLALALLMLVPGAGAREPTQLRKCQTISQPGSYELADNLVAPGGDCLVITADFVTIDLAGFSISATIPGGTGILAAPSSGQQSIAVRNGSITGFSDGVDLGGGSILEGLLVFRNFRTGIIAFGIVKGNTATETFLGTGIFATGVVTGNYVSESRFSGIVVGQGSTVIGNTVTGSRGVGLDVSCPSNVTDNTAINNGIELPGHPNITLRGEGCNNTNNVAP